MATQQRIDELKKFCQQCQRALQSAEQLRNELLSWQNNHSSISENGKELLPTLIEEANSAVQQHKKVLTQIESILDRAIAGEDI